MADHAAYALSMLKRADGGAVAGALHGVDGGRTDVLPINVQAGAYVLPADVVSGMPGAQGNSLAGHNALNKLFASLPIAPDAAPYGAETKKLPRGKTMPGLVNPHRLQEKALAAGGVAGHAKEHVPILAAAGEHVVPPEIVKQIGMGDLDRGHSILDAFVMAVRKRNIAELKKLPKPAKD